jgi:hypothetical protein
MAEKEASSDQPKTKNSSTKTGTESSERRNLLAVTNYGKVTEFIYTDGTKEVIRNG